MSGSRYSIMPADALNDVRNSDKHVRVLGIMGSHSDGNGWLQMNQKTIAKQASTTRETVNRIIRDLVNFGYLRKLGRVGDDGRRLINMYQVVLDRDPVERAAKRAIHVTPTSPGVCDAHVTGYVTKLDHRVCDLQTSQLTDLFLERPLSTEVDDRRTTPTDELAKVLDQQRAAAVIDHRKRIRKPLTAYAAKLLASKLALVDEPNHAADVMIANGWQGFEPEWLNERTSRRGGSVRPNRTPTLGELAADRLKEIQTEDLRVIDHT
ncbi:MAG: helix-turn-helix domain-containing protein [Mesorhizobium sp.]|nr:MAG: helix-turn-helix domain-containing protein [Mesorhizobium sp.]TIN23235.1 MAG: helix-turn-helix domain-containing protein [Mesorhizobium sp.]TIN33629.1 MAG: helix-turn-helix domain-containing protein [Mesorhizobium sp.]TJU73868.1 MAG: helix-turn-helix domain-containing protein [Mesorhizobium sp.]TJU84217.1 MAG: helix-turn-helix domain-containing protein [Mesorhizobium sp.]